MAWASCVRHATGALRPARCVAQTHTLSLAKCGHLRLENIRTLAEIPEPEVSQFTFQALQLCPTATTAVCRSRRWEGMLAPRSVLCLLNELRALVDQGQASDPQSSPATSRSELTTVLLPDSFHGQR